MASILESFNKVLSVADKIFINYVLKAFKTKPLNKIAIPKLAKNTILVTANKHFYIFKLKPTKQSVSSNYIELNNACRT
ncbi:MAG: hypothetical protein ACTH59_00750 [Pseudoalteromonas nigrifaciens]|uniref:hypothetical protein n=1 Tax=Pseudoalteromonas nigrifaciens TaxID=28109 RepID=UPI003F9B1F41